PPPPVGAALAPRPLLVGAALAPRPLHGRPLVAAQAPLLQGLLVAAAAPLLQSGDERVHRGADWRRCLREKRSPAPLRSLGRVRRRCRRRCPQRGREGVRWLAGGGGGVRRR